MDFKSFKKLAHKGNMIAVSEHLSADLETPVSSFLKLAKNHPHAFLLESAEQAESIGRYSIISIDPHSILLSKQGKVFLTKKGKTKKLGSDKQLLSIMKNILSKVKLANPEAIPGLKGGFVGYFGYENVQHFEDIQLKVRKGPNIPDSIFFFTRDLVIFDHFLKSLTVVSLVSTKKRSLTAAYREARNKIQTHIKKVKSPLRQSKSKPKSRRLKITSNMTKAQFEKKVQKVKSYIRAGDCIQTVLSQRFKFPKVEDDFQIYRALRSINPSPYMFYFRSGKFRLIGSSPELLVKKNGRQVEVRPIAGTRPRGKSQKDDLRYEESLKKSPKEMAEHLMLVDLGRNDLGRVCKFETVKVSHFARIERYSHVMHLVSDVVGTLKPGKDAFDLVKATFPAGTLTGAPKIRAMEIINELEHEKRGPYAGCLGYFGLDQNLDMCITIRTLVCDGKNTYLQAGAGIVKDSHPTREFQETENKARALLRAFQLKDTFV